jgi:hypothetical protein
MANTADDKVLQSENGNENKTLNYIRFNLGWNGKGNAGGVNIAVECKSKPSGQPLNFGDLFLLKVEPATKALDDGKPYLLSCTKCGYDPLVRLASKAEVLKDNSYWKFHIPGASGVVQAGIPTRLAAAIVSEGVGRPPQWLKDLGKEIKVITDDVKEAAKKAKR